MSVDIKGCDIFVAKYCTGFPDFQLNLGCDFSYRNQLIAWKKLC